MEWVPSDDALAEARGEGVLEHLCHALQLLASPAQAQLSHFPAGWVVLADEMALDFDHWARCVSPYWKLSPGHRVQLSRLDDFLKEMSGSLHRDFWTDEALSSDPRWEQVRTLARAALVAFGWPIEIPPVAREEQGMLVDNGSSFFRSPPPS